MGQRKGPMPPAAPHAPTTPALALRRHTFPAPHPKPTPTSAAMSVRALSLLALLASLGFTGCQGYVSGRPAPLSP